MRKYYFLVNTMFSYFPIKHWTWTKMEKSKRVVILIFYLPSHPSGCFGVANAHEASIIQSSNCNSKYLVESIHRISGVKLPEQKRKFFWQRHQKFRCNLHCRPWRRLCAVIGRISPNIARWMTGTWERCNCYFEIERSTYNGITTARWTIMTQVVVNISIC